MTNEQLAILLQSYANQLDTIIKGLTLDLEGVEVERELETRYEWRGEDEEPKSLLFNFPKSFNSDYKAVQEPTGDPIMLSPLKEFKGTLLDAIGKLEEGND